MKSIEFDKVPGISRLFVDFLSGKPFFNERFPLNEMLFDAETKLNEIANRNSTRSIVSEVIRNTMAGIDLTYSQKTNLDLYSQPNTLAVVTGQQAGFLGGPLYGLLKAHSAASLAEKLSSRYLSLNFVPVFWVEDNDHDNLEASLVHIYDSEYKPTSVTCDKSSVKDNLTSVSELVFGSDISGIIDEVLSLLPENENKQNISSLLRKIYIAGKNWSGAFVELFSYLLGNHGVLFVSSAGLRKAGLFAGLVQKELNQPGLSNSLIESENNLLAENGYHIQAKSSEINLFFHENGKRLKINSSKNSNHNWNVGNNEYSNDELIQLGNTSPELFSPKVLLRPVFQDSLLPTAAYIGGPSEIAYCCQIKSLYKHFGINQPAFYPRHSATFLSKKIDRILEKEKREPNYFWTKFADIETEISKSLSSEKIEKLFNSIYLDTKDNLHKIEELAESFDEGVLRSAQASGHKVISEIEIIFKKLTSANKKKYSEIFARYKSASDYIFPHSTLQERIISPISIISIIGFELLNDICIKLTENFTDKHYIFKSI